MKRVRNTPLYLLAKEEICIFITESDLKAGDRLPAESVLCTQLGISRGSLREAMRALEEEDVVVRKQGLGTFVTHGETVIHSTLDVNEGVSEMIRGKGMVPGTCDLQVLELVPNQKIANQLGIEGGVSVVSVKRLRTANGVPVALTEDFLPKGLVPENRLAQLGDRSLYDLLEEDLGMELSSSILKLKPMKATKSKADALGIKAGDLLLFLQQTDTSKDREPVLYSEEYFVSQRFEFEVIRKRKMKFDRIYGK
jgi:GntR family transcriptional regulator